MLVQTDRPVKHFWGRKRRALLRRMRRIAPFLPGPKMPPNVLRAWRSGDFASGWWAELDDKWVVYALTWCLRQEARQTDRLKAEYRRTETLLVELMWSPFADLAVTTVEDLWGHGTRLPERYSLVLMSAIGAYRAGRTPPTLAALETSKLEGRTLALTRIMDFLCLWRARRLELPSRAVALRFPTEAVDSGYHETPPTLRPDLLNAYLWLAKFAPAPLPDARMVDWKGGNAADLRAAAAALACVDFPGALHIASQISNLRARSRAFVAVGKAAMGGWRLLDALDAVNEALGIWHELAPAHALKAAIFQLLGDRTSAVKAAETALVYDPLNSDAARIVQTLQPQNLSIDLASVMANVQAAARPLTAAHHGAIMLIRAGKMQDAERLLEATISGWPQAGAALAPLQWHLAHCAELAEDYSTALSRFHDMDTTDPSYAYKRHIGLARCHMELGDYAAANEQIEKAEAHDHSEGLPQRYEPTRMDLRLLQERIEEAFLEYRNRRPASQFLDTFGEKYPRFDKKILEQTNLRSAFVFPEGGPGDEIRLTSLLDDIRDTYPKLTAACDPRLYSIFSRSFPTVSFIPVKRSRREFRTSDYFARQTVRGAQAADCLNDTAVKLGKDADIALSYLDLLPELRPNRAAFPRRAAYLKADEARVVRWKNFLERESTTPGAMRIALTWRSMLTNPLRDRHYLTVSHLQPLAALSNVEFWITQTGITLAEIAEIKTLLPNVHFPHGLDLRDDFEEQAAFFVNMDLAVAPCTTHAEFAASLGCRTLFLTNMASTLWRRNPDGSDVWHASARQVCGEQLGDRESLVWNIVQQIAASSTRMQASKISHTRPTAKS